MSEISREEIKSLLRKYQQKISTQLDIPVERASTPKFTREYNQFKKENFPAHLSIYEQLCNYSEKILKIKPSKKKEESLQESIDICHLNITPTGVTSLSFLLPMTVIVLGTALSFSFTNSFFFVFFFFIIGVLMINPIAKIPEFIANNWRMKASNQMVLCIFYVVTYMRHTSNIELAIEFASEHLTAPLSLDLKKVIWDVETEKYDSVRESLDMYLETWRKWNLEFIESFHLIESSLYEGDESRRITLLDKSLDVILDETYEKMLHYAQNLKGPITMLHMMGIILPILGLVVMPLIVSFMENVSWFHIAALYNILLPILVYYLSRNILSRRPTGYGDTDLSQNPEVAKYKNILIKLGNFEVKIHPIFVSIIIGFVLLLIGLSPIILHILNPDFDITIGENFKLLGYKVSTSNPNVEKGPYGLGASILSLFITLAFGISIGLYFRLRSKNIIKIRENAKNLEKEFASALFQLGNRLGDGLPAEIAFDRVSTTMRDTISGNFFEVVSMNIRKLGMGVKDAIFNPKTGALVYFPSNIIESSMKVLIESLKKGPRIAAHALVNISRYIKEIHKVNERLKDLMSDIISSMKSQISFLTPAISGIVVGITSMITSILGKLGALLPQVAGGGEDAIGGAQALIGLFGDSIPTYFFQIVVGVYVIEIVYIITILSNGVENGSDKLNERYLLGNNLIKSTILYVIIALIVTILFNFIAGAIMTKSLTI
jgi:hypothetical protein